MRRNLVLLATSVALLSLPGVAAAQEPTPTTAPATTLPPSTTEAPATTVAPAEAPAGETTLSVGDETAFRAALTALSVDVTGPHTIDLTADITLDDGIDPTYVGTQPLTIDGHGFTMDAEGSSRLLVMDSPNDAPLTITAVTMINGSSPSDGGALLVRNDSPATVSDSTFIGNGSQGDGGAIAVSGDLSVARTTFESNAVLTGDGGALVGLGDDAVVTVVDSTFDTNQAAGGRGGAIALTAVAVPLQSGRLDVERTTFVTNRASQGGALSSSLSAFAANSTFVGNTASDAGGAIFLDDAPDFGTIYATIADNSAPDGANLAAAARGVTITMLASVMVEPSGGENCNEFARVNGQPLHADDTSCGPHDLGPALLGPLQDNGGPTLTRAPLPGSPLIDAIRADAYTGIAGLGEDCAPTSLTEDVDQRGEPRPVEGDGEQAFDTGIVPDPPPLPPGCDIGAVEVAFVAGPPTGPVAASPGFTG